MMLFYEMMWWIIHLWREKKCKMYYVLNSSYCNAMSIVIDDYCSILFYILERAQSLRIITVKIDNLHTFYPVIILITLRTR